LTDPPSAGEPVVVDASALVELLTRTPTGGAVARRLASVAPIAPDIIDAEVASSLRRQQLWGGLDEPEVRDALDLLVDWPVPRVPTRLIVRASRRWWGNVSSCDALYLAVARAAGASVLTCDGRLSRAPGTGVPVENVRVT